MKILINILFLYILALVALPSVRAIKMFVSQDCNTACHHAIDSDSGCEKGKVIMGLNFNPVQFVSELNLKPEILFSEFKIEKEKSNYEKIFIPKYQQSIWHPPKIFM